MNLCSVFGCSCLSHVLDNLLSQLILITIPHTLLNCKLPSGAEPSPAPVAAKSDVQAKEAELADEDAKNEDEDEDEEEEEAEEAEDQVAGMDMNVAMHTLQGLSLTLYACTTCGSPFYCDINM